MNFFTIYIFISSLIILSFCLEDDDILKKSQDAATRKLFASILKGDVDVVIQALDEGARINERRTSFSTANQTPLMASVLGGKSEIVKILLERGANVKLAEKDGYSPFHGAAFQGRADIAKMLFEHGNVPNEMHQDGFYPIHRACWGKEKRHTETLKVFLDFGVSPYLKARNGESLKDICQKNGNFPSLKVVEDAIKEFDKNKSQEL